MRYLGWDLSTKRSAIVEIRKAGPLVHASWTRGPRTSDMNRVLSYFSAQIAGIEVSPGEQAAIFIDWAPTESFIYPKTNKRFLSIKSFLAGWIYADLTRKGWIVAFLSPVSVRKMMGIPPRAKKEVVHHVLGARFGIKTTLYNEHELDAIALAIAGNKLLRKPKNVVSIIQ